MQTFPPINSYAFLHFYFILVTPPLPNYCNHSVDRRTRRADGPVPSQKRCSSVMLLGPAAQTHLDSGHDHYHSDIWTPILQRFSPHSWRHSSLAAIAKSSMLLPRRLSRRKGGENARDGGDCFIIGSGRLAGFSSTHSLRLEKARVAVLWCSGPLGAVLHRFL